MTGARHHPGRSRCCPGCHSGQALATLEAILAAILIVALHRREGHPGRRQRRNPAACITSAGDLYCLVADCPGALPIAVRLSLSAHPHAFRPRGCSVTGGPHIDGRWKPDQVSFSRWSRSPSASSPFHCCSTGCRSGCGYAAYRGLFLPLPAIGSRSSAAVCLSILLDRARQVAP